MPPVGRYRIIQYVARARLLSLTNGFGYMGASSLVCSSFVLCFIEMKIFNSCVCDVSVSVDIQI